MSKQSVMICCALGLTRNCQFDPTFHALSSLFSLSENQLEIYRSTNPGSADSGI